MNWWPNDVNQLGTIGVQGQSIITIIIHDLSRGGHSNMSHT